MEEAFNALRSDSLQKNATLVIIRAGPAAVDKEDGADDGREEVAPYTADASTSSLLLCR